MLRDGQQVADVLVSCEHLTNSDDSTRQLEINMTLGLRLRVISLLTPLMWFVKLLLSSSDMVCWALLPADPLVATFPPLTARIGAECSRRAVTSYDVVNEVVKGQVSRRREGGELEVA